MNIIVISSRGCYYINMIALIILLLFFRNYSVNCQNDLNDTLYINKLNKEALEIYKQDTFKAIELTNQAIQLSKKTDYSIGIANSYYNLGQISLAQNNYKKALDYYHSSFAINSELENIDGVIADLRGIGYTNKLLGNYNEAIKIYQELLEMGKQYDDIGLRIKSLGNIGAILGDNYDTLNSILYFKEALDLSNKYKNNALIIWLSASTGHNYTLLSDYQTALEYLEIAEEYFLKMEDKAKYAYVYRFKGITYLRMNKLEEAKRNFWISLEFHTTSNNAFEMSWDLQHMGFYYEKTGNIQEAIINYKKAVDIALRIDNKLGLVELYNNLFLCYKNIDALKALDYFQQYVSYKNKVFSEKTQNQIISMKIKYETEKKDQEILLLKNKQKLNRIKNLAAVVVILMAVIISILTYYALKRKINDSKMENLRLEKELELKNKELTTNVILYAKKNEVTNDIISRLTKTLKNFKWKNRKMIEAVILELKSESNNNMWKEFELLFKNTHASFFDNLGKVNPDLTSNEKRLCALIHMKLTGKEISDLTNMNQASVYVARYRLKKKLNLPKNEPLNNFLNTL